MNAPDSEPGPAAPDLKSLDPRGLIREAYRIDGVTAPDCRAIFFDWALGRGAAEGSPEAIAALLAHYGPGRETHPMTEVLRQGTGDADRAGERENERPSRRRKRRMLREP